LIKKGVTSGFDNTLKVTEAENFTVRVGSTYDRRTGEEVKVSDVYVRKEYRGRTSKYDIGILKLAKSINLDGVTKKATKLPSSSDYNVEDETNCYVQGWGVNPNDPDTHHLYRADVSTYNTTECANQWSQPVYVQHQVCALGEDDADACSVSETI
jgi:hypothetical protein